MIIIFYSKKNKYQNNTCVEQVTDCQRWAPPPLPSLQSRLGVSRSLSSLLSPLSSLSVHPPYLTLLACSAAQLKSTVFERSGFDEHAGGDFLPLASHAPYRSPSRLLDNNRRAGLCHRRQHESSLVALWVASLIFAIVLPHQQQQPYHHHHHHHHDRISGPSRTNTAATEPEPESHPDSLFIQRQQQSCS